MSRRIGFHRMLRGFRGVGFTADARIHVDALGEARNQFGSIDYSVGNILPDETFDITGVLMSYSRYLNLNPNADGYDASHVLYVERNNRFFDCDYVMFSKEYILEADEIGTPAILLPTDSVEGISTFIDLPNAYDENDLTYATGITQAVDYYCQSAYFDFPAISKPFPEARIAKVELIVKHNNWIRNYPDEETDFRIWIEYGAEFIDSYLTSNPGMIIEDVFDITDSIGPGTTMPSITSWDDFDFTLMNWEIWGLYNYLPKYLTPSDKQEIRVHEMSLRVYFYDTGYLTTGRPAFVIKDNPDYATIIDTEDGLIEFTKSATVTIYIDKMAVKNVEEVDEHYMALFLGAWS